MFGNLLRLKYFKLLFQIRSPGSCRFIQSSIEIKSYLISVPDLLQFRTVLKHINQLTLIFTRILSAFSLYQENKPGIRVGLSSTPKEFLTWPTVCPKMQKCLIEHKTRYCCSIIKFSFVVDRKHSDIELPLYVVIIVSYNAITCFLVFS